MHCVTLHQNENDVDFSISEGKVGEPRTIVKGCTSTQIEEVGPVENSEGGMAEEGGGTTGVIYGRVDGQSELVGETKIVEGIAMVDGNAMVAQNGMTGDDGMNEEGAGVGEKTDTYIGDIYLEVIKEMLSATLVITIEDLIYLSGGRCSGISIELKNILRSLYIPRKYQSRRLVGWNQAIVALEVLTYGCYAFTPIRW